MKYIIAVLENKNLRYLRDVIDLYNNDLMLRKVKYLSYYFRDNFNEFPSYIDHLYSIIKQSGNEVKVMNIDYAVYNTEYTEDTNIIVPYLNLPQDKMESIIKQLNGKYRNVIVYNYDRKDVDNIINIYNMNGMANLLGLENYKLEAYPLKHREKLLHRAYITNGCNNSCSFCTLPKKTRLIKINKIEENFEYVLGKKLYNGYIYVGDSSFGDIEKEELSILKHYNNKYSSRYIVQTTVKNILNSDLEEWKKVGIDYVEIGIEFFSNSVLKKVRKQQSTKEIIEAIIKVKHNYMKPIGNMIIGYPCNVDGQIEGFKKSLNAIKLLEFMNIFNYSNYNSNNNEDRNELNLIKPLNEKYKDSILKYADMVYRENYELLNKL